MIRRLTLGRQSDIRPAHLKHRLEAAEIIGLTGGLTAQAYLTISCTGCPPPHAQ